MGESSGHELASFLVAIGDDLSAQADLLNELDARSGDGDMGVTMSIGAQAVRSALAELGPADSAAVLRTCGTAFAREAPSTSGTLVATGLLRAAGAVAGGASGTSSEAFAICLQSAVRGIQERGGAELGSKTMLDALSPAADAASATASAGGALGEVVAAAAAAADAGARATVGMQPRHGRAGWLAERSAGHEDAGARLVAIVLAAAADRIGSSAGSPL